MKNSIVLAALILIAFIFCTACQGASEEFLAEEPSQSYGESDLADESNSSVPELLNPSDTLEFQQKNALLYKADAQEIDASPLLFTQVLGVRKRYPNSLPSVIAFQYPYVFYEQYASVTEGADESEGLSVGRYCIETQEVQKVILGDFSAISNDAHVQLNQDQFVYLYCMNGGEDGLVMKLALLDFKTETATTLLTQPVINVFGCVQKINETEIVFLLTKRDGYDAVDVCMVYNLEDGSVRTIITGDTITSTAQGMRIQTIDVCGNDLFLLLTQTENGKNTFSLAVIDSSYLSIFVEELSALSPYAEAQGILDGFTVCNDALFLHIWLYDKGELDVSPGIVLQSDENTCRLFNTNDSSPKYFLGEILEPSVTRFFTCADEASFAPILVAYDLSQQKSVKFALDLYSMEGCAMDENGNLLVAERKEDDSCAWYFYSAQQLKECIASAAQIQSYEIT